MSTSLWSTSELSYARVPLSSAADQSSSSASSAKRTDGRSALSFRDVALSTSTSKAQGAIASSTVTVNGNAVDGGGQTKVEAGVRAEVDSMHGDNGGKIIHLSTLLTSLFSAASLPPTFLSQLVVIPNHKAWTLYLDVLIESSLGGNVIDTCIIAARSALATVRLPLTRPVGFESDDVTGSAMDQDSGFSGLVKGGKAGAKAVDFELVDAGLVVGGGGQRLKDWEKLPIGVTLSLVNQLPFLDATALEESVASSQIVYCFTSTGDLCGMKQLGEGEIEFARLSGLTKDAQRIASEMLVVLNKKLHDA
ncbi:hypothetical protein OIV83_006230 [Microbotryomycetes sp. JL201]|nr:hypothetical protein OIV83_006230 [Microbotryomycetes sp. JL201]